MGNRTSQMNTLLKKLVANQAGCGEESGHSTFFGGTFVLAKGLAVCVRQSQT